ncbi:MAG: glycosyltransferase [Lachnospiraceae bacterium]|nr:glycosyltransferase [Lachnospiraceae bacterium]
MTTNKCKHLLFFSGDITRDGGTERVATMLANQLATCHCYQISILNISMEHQPPAFPLDSSIETYTLSNHWVSAGPGYLWVLMQMRRFLSTHPVDVIIDIDGVLDVLSIPMKKKYHIPIISWDHFNYDYEKQAFYRPWIRKQTVRHADAIVTLTTANYADYIANYPHLTKVHCIPNPCVPRDGIKEVHFEQKCLLSAGHLIPIKGFHRIVPIVKALLDKDPTLSFQWLIAGQGECYEELKQQIDAAGLRDYIRLVGYTSRMDNLYEQSLAYVLLSDCEGLPMVLLEAMAYHLPCVSFDIKTGPSDIITQHVDGILIPKTEDEEENTRAMADALYPLLTDEALYRRYQTQAGAHMQKFHPSTILRQWMELIDTIVETTP